MHAHYSSLRFGCLHPRYASTSAGPFPFPAHTRPTPHQIFHLPAGATQKEIKARYYELVRVHHPDSPFGHDLSSEQRRARFQAITAAYDTLRGKRGRGEGGPQDAYRQELERRRRAYERARHNNSGFTYERAGRSEWTASADDRWKDRVILFVGILALGAGVGPALLWPSYTASYQAHVSAARNLAQARKDAREFGEERRREIRRRVEEYEREKSGQVSPDVDSTSTSNSPSV